MSPASLLPELLLSVLIRRGSSESTRHLMEPYSLDSDLHYPSYYTRFDAMRCVIVGLDY